MRRGDRSLFAGGQRLAPPGLIIRDLEPRDRLALERWYQGLSLHIGRTDPRHLVARPPAEYFHRYASSALRSLGKNGGFVLVAVLRGRRAGFLSGELGALLPPRWRHDTRPHFPGYFADIFLEPWARGQGVGTALFEEGGRRLRELGCDNLHLGVSGTNARARALYRELGFQEMGIRMRRDIASAPRTWAEAQRRRRRALQQARRVRPGSRKALQRASVMGLRTRSRR
jgi:ribosomal protein S18 acetylase RimI-like enzyme